MVRGDAGMVPADVGTHQPASAFRRAGRLLVIAALSVLALAPVAAAGAELQTFELPSELVDASTPGGTLEDGRTVQKVHVLLPGGYRADSKRGYPVLWLLHGANGGTDTWIPDITMLAAGFPGIVVMPDGGQFGMYVDWWNDGVRDAPAWSTYHLQVLRREIERRFPIRRGRRWHAIAGISMGGQGALRYAAMLPGYFGSVAGRFRFAAPPSTVARFERSGGKLIATGAAPSRSTGRADADSPRSCHLSGACRLPAVGRPERVLVPQLARSCSSRGVGRQRDRGDCARSGRLRNPGRRSGSAIGFPRFVPRTLRRVPVMARRAARQELHFQRQRDLLRQGLQERHLLAHEEPPRMSGAQGEDAGGSIARLQGDVEDFHLRRAVGPPSRHPAGLEGRSRHVHLIQHIVLNHGRQVSRGRPQLAFLVRQHRHDVAIEDVGDVPDRDLQDILDASGARELAAETVHCSGLPLLEPGERRLLSHPGGQVADHEPHQTHHRERDNVLDLVHGERVPGWHEEEIERQHAQERRQDRRPPPALGRGEHHSEQVDHDEIAQVEVGIHRKTDERGDVRYMTADP